MAKSHFKTVFGSIVASVILSLSGIFGVMPVSAAEHPIYLWVSPANQDLGNLEPGSTYDGKFIVQNSGTEEFSYKVYASPYYVTDDNYSPSYTTSNNYTYISEWFTFSKTEGHLKPQENEEVTFKVKVPSDAAGGAQNAAIMVETEDSADGTSTVQPTVRIGSVVYSNVNGETNACGKVVDKNIPTWLFNPPISASARVENCGNIDLNVKYVMTVTPLFSDEPVYTTEENPTILSTLPETRRYTSVTWDNSPSIGFYNVKLEVTYNGDTESIEKLVLICPLWVIILIIVFIGAVVFWLVSRSRERKEKEV